MPNQRDTVMTGDHLRANAKPGLPTAVLHGAITACDGHIHERDVGTAISAGLFDCEVQYNASELIDLLTA